MDGRIPHRVIRRHPLEESAVAPEQAVDERRGGGAGRERAEGVDKPSIIKPDEASWIEGVAQAPDGPLQHRRGTPYGVMPVDLAKHHIPGEDQHLGGRAALVGDGQRRAVLVEAEAGEQPLLVKMPAVRNAGVEAVAAEVVHLVDIDRPREQRVQNAARRVGGRAHDEGGHAGRIEAPRFGEHGGRFATGEDVVHECFVPGKPGQPHVFDRMAEGPVADVMHQRRHQKRRRVGLVDLRDKPGVVLEPRKKFERPPVNPQRVLEP